jgi:hypothetical protein
MSAVYEQGVILLGLYALWQEFFFLTKLKLSSTLHSLVTQLQQHTSANNNLLIISTSFQQLIQVSGVLDLNNK